ncbi:hypothetical protein [Streptomyces brevispora]|uniref:Uncharacterized protein n=1 Tax=Streptomyces brevispora TaxID=887462 RepID=A0ABZ1GDS9_9ACTN|nr:hypothetical protein [Streptomyces brevispora]WSC17428.1 hypothetical protein OIE64_34525 [Streptomyces brevispora]
MAAGEIGIVGAAAALADAVRRATGAGPHTLPLTRTDCCRTCPEG